MVTREAFEETFSGKGSLAFKWLVILVWNGNIRDKICSEMSRYLEITKKYES